MLKKTWASYWGFEAFEERRREGVDHRSGGMAVLVHARFDDPLELANGVFTLTVLPHVAADTYIMTIKVQDGDVSVTNPDLGALPEEIAVRVDAAGGIEITRLARSNLVGPSARVLSDAQVTELFQQGREVTLRWRRRVNASLPAAQEIETLTLDFEFKGMAAGWLALKPGIGTNPERLIIKQGLTLEPSLRNIPGSVQALAIPRDILARARLVTRVTCLGDATTIQVLTDPLFVPDVGFGTEPFFIGDAAHTVESDDACVREIIYGTPDHYLIEMLEAGTLLNLSP